MRILVTGGAGFIGSWLVTALLDIGHQVAVIDNLVTGNLLRLDRRAVFYQTDICDKSLLTIIQKEQSEIVFHLAAQVSVKNSMNSPRSDLHTNIDGSVNLFQLSGQNGVKKIIYTSSAAVYGFPLQLPISENDPIKPLSAYGISKYAAEMYLQLISSTYGMDHTIFRFANVYGSGQSTEQEGGVVAIFADKLYNSHPIEVFGDGEQTRDFIFVNDVVTACLKSIDYGNNEIFNISTGQANSVNQVHQSITRILGKEGVIKYLPARPGDIRHSVLNPEKANDMLGWNARYDLEHGLKTMFAS